MSDVDDIFKAFADWSKHLHKLGEQRVEAITKRRKDAQNRPSVRDAKSKAMKKYWKKKKQKEIDDEIGRELEHEYRQTHCVCHLGNPPCSFCTDSNYCEECDVNTAEDECPECGKEFD